jgi:hypothetical protein
LTAVAPALQVPLRAVEATHHHKDRVVGVERGDPMESFVGLIAEQKAAATFRSQSSGLGRDQLADPEEREGGVDSSRSPVASRSAIPVASEKCDECSAHQDRSDQ